MANDSGDNSATTKAAWKPVEHTEEARKAQRASLTWSALTIVAAIGMTGTDASEPVRLLPFALVYDQWLLVLMLWIAALVYVLFYSRAERVVRHANVEFARKNATTWDEALNLAEAAKTHTTGIEKQAATISHHYSVMAPLHSQYSEALEAQEKALVALELQDNDNNYALNSNKIYSEVSDAVARYHRSRPDPEEDSSIASDIWEQAREALHGDLATAITSQKHDVSVEHGKALKLVRTSLKDMKIAYADTANNLAIVAEEESTLAKNIASLRTDLKRFRAGIDLPERGYYWTLDVVLVYAAFAFATASMGWHAFFT